MGKVLIIILIIIFLIIGASAYYAYSIGLFSLIFNKSNPSSNTGTFKSVTYNITKQNLAPFLQDQPFVQDIPNSVTIFLKLFNTDTGEKEWEENYVIKKNSVIQTQLMGSPDITINLHCQEESLVLKQHFIHLEGKYINKAEEYKVGEA